jgi:hypothetical protein
VTKDEAIVYLKAAGFDETWVKEAQRAYEWALRDIFAARALQGILAAQATSTSGGVVPVDKSGAAFFATHAYRYADAMLEARKK